MLGLVGGTEESACFVFLPRLTLVGPEILSLTNQTHDLPHNLAGL